MTDNLKQHLTQIRRAALEAVDPARAVQRFLHIEQGASAQGAQAAGLLAHLPRADRVLLVAAGKAAVPMAQAAAQALGERIAAGLIVTKYGHASQKRLPTAIETIEAGHPVPDQAGLTAAERLLGMLESATAGDFVLLLLSGGASALLPLPVPGISLADLQELTSLLLRAGASIGELNTVRKHLDRMKGGGMARAAAPSPLLALILSDVVGDPLDVIASGPAVPDPTTFQQAWDILQRYDLLEKAPESTRSYLAAGRRGQAPETPKPGDPLFESVENHIIGSNRLAALAARDEAERLGYRALLLSTFIEGEARQVGRVAAGLAKGVRLQGDPFPPPACLIFGGETTVTVRGSGSGGRNQELALAAALALESLPDVGLMALATDGSDGPTDAAGAIVDGETILHARELGLDPYAALENNDAYPFLRATGSLMLTGPTGTNVNDLTVILVR